MKRHLTLPVFTTLLSLTIWLIASAPLALAQTPTTLTGFSVTDINIRTAPGLSAGSVGILPAGEKVTAIGRNDGNNWIQVQFSTTTGWVAAWLTVYSGDTALLTVASSTNPEPVGGPGPFDATSPFNVNIRSVPDVKAGLIKTMPFKDQAVAIGRNAASSWINVSYGGVKGWAAAWLLILSGDTNALPITSGEVSVTPTATGNAPTVTEQPAEGTATQSATEPTTPIQPPPGGGIGVSTPSKANIRTAPSSTATVIGTLSYTDAATAVGQNASHNWLQVIGNGVEGWVARWVVITSDDTAGLPVTSNSAEILPVPGGAGILGKSTYDVIIHSGPGINYGTLATLPAYTSAPLIARTEENNWVQVNFEGTVGWVAAWLMACTNDYTNLPIAPNT